MENYKLDQLQEMSIEKLTEIATGLGLKKIDPADRQQIAFDIIDAAAEVAAASTPAKESKRRGRKPKASKKEETKTEPTESAEAAAPAAAAEQAEESRPQKRARKTKAAKEKETEAPKADNADSDTPAAENADQPQPRAKKRGRKTKAANEQPEETATANDANQQPAAEEQQPAEVSDEAAKEAPLPDNNDRPAADTEQKPQQQRQDFRPRSDSSFNDFFPVTRHNARQFKPRTEQQRQEDAERRAAEAEAEANAPIVLTEPGQQAQLNQMNNKRNKFDRRNNQQNQQQNRIMEVAAKFDGIIKTEGVLEIDPQGFGFLRSSDYNYMPSPDDVLLTQYQIKQLGLKTGDVVEATVRPPHEGEKYYPLTEVLSVNGRDPRVLRDRQNFEHLTPLFPDEKFRLCGSPVTTNLSTRVVDMFAPIGKGQRALIVAPPKTGKTILLKDIANAIAQNHPETYIMILLIDERPEEVTDMKRTVNAEVIASTFDEPADRHVRIANIVLEKAKRMVESGHDVVILLDSITRLARAFNTVAPGSGKILSGGVDANALQKPKRFFGAARNIENGGSLTIIATALTETSSKMDEVIFEEFKGTGNMELQLDRKLSNKRVFPAVDIMASSTRRDDLLLPKETIQRMWIMRRFLSDRTSIEAMEFIKDRMERTQSNDELLRTMGD